MPILETEYYRAASIQEAIQLFYQLRQENKYPMYYSGGTEIITLKRVNIIQPGAIIDIKGIPECHTHELNEQFLITGAALPLTLLENLNFFPLLTKTARGVADHTARNKITLGGNICGQIFYREAVLPFFLADSYVLIAGYDGIKSMPIHTIFNQNLHLEEGQFLLQLMTEKIYLDLPYFVLKRRQQWESGYPLITFAAMKKDQQIRVAFSGLCPFPFRSEKVESELNNSQLPFEERINRAIIHLPSPILDDVEGSKEYRIFVLKQTLFDILMELEGI